MTSGVRSSGPTGPELAEELGVAAAKAGVPLQQFVAPLTANNPWAFLTQLRKAKRPTPLTVERVRACCAGLPVPEPRTSPCEGHFGGPKRFVSGEHLESKIERARKQALGDAARERRRPGETLGDALRRIGREADAEEQAEAAEERRRALSRLASPSALIRRATEEWPAQSARVAAIAAEQGIARGEAWLRVIEAGIDTLTNGGSYGLDQAR